MIKVLEFTDSLQLVEWDAFCLYHISANIFPLLCLIFKFTKDHQLDHKMLVIVDLDMGCLIVKRC